MTDNYLIEYNEDGYPEDIVATDEPTDDLEIFSSFTKAKNEALRILRNERNDINYKIYLIKSLRK